MDGPGQKYRLIWVETVGLAADGRWYDLRGSVAKFDTVGVLAVVRLLRALLESGFQSERVSKLLDEQVMKTGTLVSIAAVWDTGDAEYLRYELRFGYSSGGVRRVVDENLWVSESAAAVIPDLLVNQLPEPVMPHESRIRRGCEVVFARQGENEFVHRPLISPKQLVTAVVDEDRAVLEHVANHFQQSGMLVAGLIDWIHRGWVSRDVDEGVNDPVVILDLALPLELRAAYVDRPTVILSVTDAYVVELVELLREGRQPRRYSAVVCPAPTVAVGKEL